jgi:hypothetical protein
MTGVGADRGSKKSGGSTAAAPRSLYGATPLSGKPSSRTLQTPVNKAPNPFGSGDNNPNINQPSQAQKFAPTASKASTPSLSTASRTLAEKQTEEALNMRKSMYGGSSLLSKNNRGSGYIR